MKTCPTCRVPKELTEFHKNGTSKSGRQLWSRECKLCRQCRRRERGEYKDRDNNHYRYRRDDGRSVCISKQAYSLIIERRPEHCPICDLPFDEATQYAFRRPVLDHDHRTGQFRGVICNQCNRSLGNFNEDADVLRRAILWLSQEEASL